MMPMRRVFKTVGLLLLLPGCHVASSPDPVTVPTAMAPAATWFKTTESGRQQGVAVRIQLSLPSHNFLSNGPERWLIRYALDEGPLQQAYIDAYDSATTLNMLVAVPDAAPHTLRIHKIVSHDYLFLAPSETLSRLGGMAVRDGDGVIVQVSLTINQPN